MENTPVEINGPSMIQMLAQDLLDSKALSPDVRGSLEKIVNLAKITSKYIIARDTDKSVTWGFIRSNFT